MIEKYTIADLNVELHTIYDRTARQAEKYICEDKDAVIDEYCTINISEEVILKECEKESYRRTSPETVEYMITGGVFYRILLKYNGMMLHSSAVVVDGYAYLFSADSGTGKSTHTNLWLEKFGDRAYIINDDKPAIRKKDGEWYVYGTPWSGKHDISENKKAKLGAIVFLERSENNFIETMEPKEAITKFIAQTTRKLSKVENMDALLNNLDELLNEVPVYRLGCDMSLDAVETSYEKIRRI